MWLRRGRRHNWLGRGRLWLGRLWLGRLWLGRMWLGRHNRLGRRMLLAVVLRRCGRRRMWLGRGRLGRGRGRRHHLWLGCRRRMLLAVVLHSMIHVRRLRLAVATTVV